MDQVAGEIARMDPTNGRRSGSTQCFDDATGSDPEAATGVPDSPHSMREYGSEIAAVPQAFLHGPDHTRLPAARDPEKLYLHGTDPSDMGRRLAEGPACGGGKGVHYPSCGSSIPSLGS